MGRILLILIFSFSICNSISAQLLTQVIRGTISDSDSKIPLPGAGVLIIDSDPVQTVISDVNGEFRFENITIGRVSIQINYVGYEPKVISNLVLNSGKELVVNIQLQESILKIQEVKIMAQKERGKGLNEMSTVSTRAISAEESQRFAGGFSDPSRIVTAFAGVANSGDGDNDIIIRGNSPKYVQWRLEGVEIANPTHFADQNSVKGGISALNNNLLATSDFHTGAFAAEFGDVLSGVYDVKLRAGNNEKFESTFGFGLLGTDLTIEGPIKQGYNGSYLLNYRYSTISLISDLGLVDIDGSLNFQDGAFKIVLPTKKIGSFSLFGLSGASNFLVSDVKQDLWITPGDEISGSNINEDFDKGTYQINTGVNHILPLSKKSFLKTSVSYLKTDIADKIFETLTIPLYDDQGEVLRDSILDSKLDYRSKLTKSTYGAGVTYRTKLNSKNKLQIGSRYNLVNFQFHESWFDDLANSRFTAVNFDKNAGNLKNYVSWKHRARKNLTFILGLTNMNYLLIKKHTVESRLGINWKTTKNTAFNFGYGFHSKQESIHHYFAQVQSSDGNISQPNIDLDLLKSHHFVASFEKRVTKNTRGKVELYYQHLYDLPVENSDSSSFATINEGNDFRYVDLVNEGKGRNYGLELSFERFLSRNYYYLLNASFFSSKYTALDGIERNTQYNGEYLFNILAGKEFTRLGEKKNKSFDLNVKVFFGGGKKIIPLLRDQNGALAVDPDNGNFYDYSKAYESSLEDIYQIVVSSSYKWNKPKATHEIFLSLDNITNTKGKLTEYYDPDEESDIGYSSQFGFFPNLMYRVYF